jgi:hypothetical protein
MECAEGEVPGRGPADRRTSLSLHGRQTPGFYKQPIILASEKMHVLGILTSLGDDMGQHVSNDNLKEREAQKRSGAAVPSNQPTNVLSPRVQCVGKRRVQTPDVDP